MMPLPQKGVDELDAVLAVAADYANVSSEGKLNIMGIFQELNPPALPFQLPQMYLVVSWEAGPAEFGSRKDCRVIIMGPDEAEGDQLSLDYQLVVPEPKRPGARAIFHQILGIGGLPIQKSGPHAIYVLVGGETKGTVPLYVNEPIPVEGKEVPPSG
jgi:hypothetical protein